MDRFTKQVPPHLVSLLGGWRLSVLSLSAAAGAHALQVAVPRCRWSAPQRIPTVRACTPPFHELDEDSNLTLEQLEDSNLTLEQLGSMLADVRAHYRTSGELDQAQVCRNMLATRLSDLRLNRCHIGPSTLPGESGTGLFASRAIRAGELITLYPGDGLLYWADGNRDLQNGQICSGVIFGAHVPQVERSADKVTSKSARRYELQASTTVSCIGDPLLDSDPSYLGHFANDGSMCATLSAAETYDSESKAAANADHVTLEGCQLATQATKEIASGEEIFVSYGLGHWLTHAGLEAPAAPGSAPGTLRTTTHPSHQPMKKAKKDQVKKKAGRRANRSGKAKAKGPAAPTRGFGRSGPISMRSRCDLDTILMQQLPGQLSAGGQFSDRPMKDINKSGPSESRVARVQELMVTNPNPNNPNPNPEPRCKS